MEVPVQLLLYKKDYMKEVKTIAWYTLHDKIILMVGEEYEGIPLIRCKYDVLIGEKNIITRYKDALIPTFFKGHNIQIKFI